MPALAPRVEDLGTESAFEVLARARALEARGRSVLHLEIGEPDFPTPPHVTDAAIAALRAGETRYVPSAGLPPLREAIAADIAQHRGVAVDPGRIVVTTGAKPVLLYTVLATVGPGDEVLVPDPGFPIYESAVRFAGGVPVPIPLREEAGFAPRAADIAAACTPRTRLLILNSPGNPAGGVIPKGELPRIAAIAARHDLWVCSDEVYLRLAYGRPGGRAPSFYAASGAAERTVLVDSFSKTHAMTGWRLGFAALPEALVEPFVRLVVNSVSCVPPFVQAAGVAALAGSQDHVRRMLAAFGQRRQYLVRALARIAGVTCVPPAGAFYAFANVRALGRPAADIADALLEEAGVAVLPGTCFGAGGEGYLRLSYATSMDTLQAAVERIDAWVGRGG